MKNWLQKKKYIILGFFISVIFISYFFVIPIRQIYGGVIQRLLNPLIRYPSLAEERINPVLIQDFIPAIKRNKEIQEIANKILEDYTATARFQLQSIPIGEFDSALAGTHGKSVIGSTVEEYNSELLGGGYNRGKPLQATYIRQDLPRIYQVLVLRHVLLHTAIVNAGGLDTEKFMEDFQKIKNTDKELYEKSVRFIQSPFYKGVPRSLLTEELFAQLGAWKRSEIFSTPVGHHYQWILKKS